MTITVTDDAEPVTSVSINPEDTSIMAWDGTNAIKPTIQMAAVFVPEDATNQKVYWSVGASATDYDPDVTSIEDVCEIDEDGLLTILYTSTSADKSIWVFVTPDDDSNAEFDPADTAKEIIITKYVTPPLSPGLARMISVQGNNNTGGHGTAVYNVAKQHLDITGDGRIDSNNNAYHLVYVTVPVKGDVYDAEIDIVVADTQMRAPDNNSKLGLVILNGNPATVPAATMTYWLFAHHGSFPAIPYMMRKQTGNSHNNGATSGGESPAGKTIETLGIRWRSASSAYFRQKLDGTQIVDASNTNGGSLGITADSDLYIGVLVGSTTTNTLSDIAIKAIRIKYPAGSGYDVDANGYTSIDLTQAITVITAPTAP